MKKILFSVPLLAVSFSLAGCVGARSPVSTSTPRGRTTGGELATLATATALGAAGGYAVNKKPASTAIGAAVGLAAGALIHNARMQSASEHDAELVEAAKREERVRIQQEYWEAERLTSARDGTAPSPGGSAKAVNYAGGYFDGINLAARSATTQNALQEPKRP